MPPKKDNTDTTEILKAIQNMKTEIVAERKVEEQNIINQIEAIGKRLTDSISANTDRIQAIEETNTTFAEELRVLKSDVRKLKKENIEIKEKHLDSVCHSRRGNLDFLNFPEEDEEEVLPKIRAFLINTLQLPENIVNAMPVRDGHRIGRRDDKKKYPRVIKVAFLCMDDRNRIYENAYKCKDTPYAIRVDLPPELTPLRKRNLEIRKEILEENPDALASCTYRGYNRPVLLVKYNGRVQEYNPDTMDIEDLQPGDKRRRD